MILVQHFSKIKAHIGGNYLIVAAAVKIFFQGLLIKWYQVDPHYLGSFKRRGLADLIVHKSDKIKKFPASDQKVHAHHQVQVAYQFRRIMAFFLMAEKCFQLFSGLVFNPDDLPELFFAERLSGQFRQVVSQAAELAGQIFY